MTNRYDEMRIAPDPVQAEELRARLHARMASVALDDHLDHHDLDVLDIPVIDIDVTELSEPGTRTPRDRTHRRRLLMAAAAIVVVIGAGIAITDRNSSTEDLPLALAAPPLAADEIRVTPDRIQLGDGLVGGSVAKDDGRTYVVASHFEEDPLHADEPTLWWFRPKTAVLVAFDDAGVELWRTELDGVPEVSADAGDVWLLDEGKSPADGTGTLSRIDASNGRLVGQLNIGQPTSMVAAFGSVWVHAGVPGREQLIRVDPDLSTSAAELPGRALGSDPGPEGIAAGPDAIWVALGPGGVAVVDVTTLAATVIPADDIGHDVVQIAFVGATAYVANEFRITSIVDGKVVATTISSGDDAYPVSLGSIDGHFGFGELRPGALFRVLRANDPMVVAKRQVPIEDEYGFGTAINGELWMWNDRDHDLRRLHLLPE